MVYIITMKNKSHMKVNGYITEKKELELKYIVMEVNTKVNIKMELSMDQEYITGAMAPVMKENGN